MPTGPKRQPLVTRKIDPIGEHGGEATYHLYRDVGDDEEGRAQVKHGIMMGVTNRPNHTNYSYPNQAGHFGHAGRDFLSDGPGGQRKLFGMQHLEGKSKVSFMESTKESRIHAPMLLALAQQDTMRTTGRQLDADENRSGHSEKLVQHLQGAMGQQFQARLDTNNMTFDTESEGSNARNRTAYSATKAGREVVSPWEISGARGTIRNMLRRPPIQGPKLPENQQGQLFDDAPYRTDIAKQRPQQMHLPFQPPTGPRQLRPPR